MRFGVYEGLRKEAPALQFALATPVTAGCRMIKSPAEIALMQHASDVTIAAYRAGLATLREGMTQNELSGNIGAAYQALGYAARLRPASESTPRSRTAAFSRRNSKEGDIVLIDDGCSVEGYQSDITRTGVRQATARQEKSGISNARRRMPRWRPRSGRRLRSSGCRRAQGHHRCRLRSRLQSARIAASHRPRHRTG